MAARPSCSRAPDSLTGSSQPTGQPWKASAAYAAVVTLAEPTPSRAPKRPQKGSFWRELPILLGAAIVVAILVRTFVIQTYYVPSGSMEHTLDINDRVLVNKLVYDFHDPHRGDVIVFNAPDTWHVGQPDEKVFVKRVVGLPGDHVVCCADGHLTINGVQVIEPYLNADPGCNQASQFTFDIVVPVGRLWVMGDNRCQSADSEVNYHSYNNDVVEATIPDDAVIGRAFVRFWPFNRAGWLSSDDAFAHVPARG
jgi:signal peptidase I